MVACTYDAAGQKRPVEYTAKQIRIMRERDAAYDDWGRLGDATVDPAAKHARERFVKACRDLEATFPQVAEPK